MTIFFTAFTLGLIAGIIITISLTSLSALWQRAARARFGRVRVVRYGRAKDIVVRRASK